MIWDHVPRASHVPKKTKSETLSSTLGSNPPEFAGVMQNKFRLKQEAAQAAYEALRKKDEGILKMKELRFLNTPTDPNLPPDRAFLIEMQKR